MSKDQSTIVIAGACAHPGRVLQTDLRPPSGSRARQIAIKAALDRARSSGRGLGGHPGSDPVCRAGHGTRPPPPQCRHPRRRAGLGLNQCAARASRAVALGRPADRARSSRSSLRLQGSMSQRRTARIARRHQDGRHEVHRYDDQVRPVGRFQRPTTWQYGRERRSASGRSREEQDRFAVLVRHNAEAAKVRSSRTRSCR